MSAQYDNISMSERVVCPKIPMTSRRHRVSEYSHGLFYHVNAYLDSIVFNVHLIRSLSHSHPIHNNGRIRQRISAIHT
jgi:hypothetical protein